MVKYNYNYNRKNFKNKQSAEHHLENSIKKEILNLEVRNMDTSVRCVLW